MCPLIFSHNSNPLFNTAKDKGMVIDHYSTIGPATAPTEGPDLQTDPIYMNLDIEETKM